MQTTETVHLICLFTVRHRERLPIDVNKIHRQLLRVTYWLESN